MGEELSDRIAPELSNELRTPKGFNVTISMVMGNGYSHINDVRIDYWGINAKQERVDNYEGLNISSRQQNVIVASALLGNGGFEFRRGSYDKEKETEFYLPNREIRKEVSFRCSYVDNGCG